MEPELVTPPADPIAPPVEALDAPAETSLTDHEAQYGSKGTGPTPPADLEPAEPKRGQRANKQAATPEDVPRIKELTAKWRDEERKRQALEAEIATLRAKPTPQPQPEPNAAVTGFTKAEPQLADFSNHDDPYAAWLRAVNRWDREKDAFEADQAKTAKTAETAASEQEQRDAAVQHAHLEAFKARYQAFVAATPDFTEKLQAFGDRASQPIPPALEAAFVQDDNGPGLMYYLVNHPNDFDEMVLITDGKPVSDTLVATVRRLLTTRVGQAAQTGSAAPRVPATAPRPPNPVRTGSMTLGDGVPDESASLADHEKAYGPKPRR